MTSRAEEIAAAAFDRMSDEIVRAGGWADSTGPTRCVLLIGTTLPLRPSVILDTIHTGKVYKYEPRGERTAIVTFIHKAAAERLIQKGTLFTKNAPGEPTNVVIVRRLPNVDIPLLDPEASRVLYVTLEKNSDDYTTFISKQEAHWQEVDGTKVNHPIIPAFQGLIYRRDNGLNLPARLHKLVTMSRHSVPGEDVTLLQLQYFSVEDAMDDLELWPCDDDYSKPNATFGVDPSAGVRRHGIEEDWETQSEPERIPIPSVESFEPIEEAQFGVHTHVVVKQTETRSDTTEGSHGYVQVSKTKSRSKTNGGTAKGDNIGSHMERAEERMLPEFFPGHF